MARHPKAVAAIHDGLNHSVPPRRRAGPGDLDFASLRGDGAGRSSPPPRGAVYSARARPMYQHRYSPNRISTVVVCAALPMLAVVSLPQVVRQDYGGVTLGGWGALVFSVFFSLVVTNVLWFGAIQAGGAAARHCGAADPALPRRAVRVRAARRERDAAADRGGVIVVVGIWLTRRRTLVLAD